MMTERKHLFIFPVIFLIFLSLTTSKALLNLSLSLFFLLGAIFLTKETFNIINRENKGFILAPVLLFFLGLIFSAIHNNDDLSHFLSKGAFLLSCPFLFYSLSNKKIRQRSFLFFLFGLSIALIYSLYKAYDLSLTIGLVTAIKSRIASFWDVGRWSEILAYSLCISIPYLTIACKNNIRSKSSIAIIALFSFACILTSGSRAAFLSIMVTSFIFLFLTRPKLTTILIVTAILATIPFKNTNLVSSTLERITSIADIDRNLSNLSRLTMWREGFDAFSSKLSREPLDFFIGSGTISFEEKYKEFEETKYNTTSENIFSGIDFSYTDNHNTYIDLANKLGIIYLAAYLYFLYLFAKYFISNLKYNQTWAYAGLGLVLNHLIIGMFYTSGLNYQTIVLFYLLYLCYSYVEHSKLEQEEYAQS